MRFRLPIALLVALAATTLPSLVPAEAAVRPIPGPGYDISYPQCGGAYPTGGGFGIVGVTGGRNWSANGCLASEYAWASGLAAAPAFYMNTGNPGPISTHWGGSGPKRCARPSSYYDRGCAYNYGYNSARYAYQLASGAVSARAAGSRWWWLDVETSNSWNGDGAANSQSIQGGIDFLRRQGVPGIGVYSTRYQWGVITGGYSLGSVPNWLAGAGSSVEAISWCTAATSFSGGPVQLVQYPAAGYDGDYRCR